MTTKKPTVPTLQIATLGQFAVWRGAERLPDTIWQREKALRLWQYLLTKRRFMARERLLIDLWPELDESRAERDFKVAWNALNTALQPDRPPRTLAIYLARQGTSYGLNPEAPWQLDTMQLEAGLTAGSQSEQADTATAITHYRTALQLYGGEYLPDTLYEDWVSPERERLTTLYLSGVTRLARLLVAEAVVAKTVETKTAVASSSATTLEAIIWCQRIIAIDPCWEAAYRLLMRSYHLTGNRPQALRAYYQCRTALADELGVKPMRETEQLLAAIGDE